MPLLQISSIIRARVTIAGQNIRIAAADVNTDLILDERALELEVEYKRNRIFIHTQYGYHDPVNLAGSFFVKLILCPILRPVYFKKHKVLKNRYLEQRGAHAATPTDHMDVKIQ